MTEFQETWGVAIKKINGFTNNRFINRLTDFNRIRELWNYSNSKNI